MSLGDLKEKAFKSPEVWEEYKRLLEEGEVIVLSDKSFEDFARECESPQPSNEALQKALRRRNEKKKERFK